jgi:hypothetical protein
VHHVASDAGVQADDQDERVTQSLVHLRADERAAARELLVEQAGCLRLVQERHQPLARTCLCLRLLRVPVGAAAAVASNAATDVVATIFAVLPLQTLKWRMSGIGVVGISPLHAPAESYERAVCQGPTHEGEQV